jgi:hypothetical protein
MTMILKYNIFILRHEQTTSEDAIIDISAIKKEFNPVDDIAYIFSVFGDDFIPKIDWINVTKHIPRILEEYRKMDIRIIDDKTNKVNLLNLQKFFKQIKKLEGTVKLSKNRFDDLLKPVNYKSFKYYNELNDLNNLTRNYEPTFDTAENTIPALDYYKAMLWKYNYYFLDDDSSNDFYYPHHGAPTIDTLINFKEFDKVRLEEYKTTDIMPIDQLCFISPINVSQYVEKQKINKELANKLYKIMKIKLPEIKVDSKGDVNVNEIFDCHNARYLNKCYVRFNIIKFQDFKKLIGAPSDGQMGRIKRVVERDQNYEYIIDEIYNYKYEYLEQVDKFLTNNCFDTQRYSLNELKVRYSTDNIHLMIMNEDKNVVYACLLWISGNNIYLSSICVSNDKRSQGVFKKAMIFLAK